MGGRGVGKDQPGECCAAEFAGDTVKRQTGRRDSTSVTQRQAPDSSPLACHQLRVCEASHTPAFPTRGRSLQSSTVDPHADPTAGHRKDIRALLLACYTIATQDPLHLFPSALRYIEQGSPFLQFPSKASPLAYIFLATVSWQSRLFYQAPANSSSLYPLTNSKATSTVLGICYSSA